MRLQCITPLHPAISVTFSFQITDYIEALAFDGLKCSPLCLRASVCVSYYKLKLILDSLKPLPHYLTQYLYYEMTYRQVQIDMVLV